MPERFSGIKNSPHNALYTSDSSPMSQQFSDRERLTLVYNALWGEFLNPESNSGIQLLQSLCEKTKLRARDCERVYCHLSLIVADYFLISLFKLDKSQAHSTYKQHVAVFSPHHCKVCAHTATVNYCCCTCCTKSNWLDFMQQVAVTIFYH